MARYVRVSTISFSGVKESPEKKVERNLEEALRLLRRAALEKPDIVCLPETFAVLSLDSPGVVPDRGARSGSHHRRRG